jgi:PAS domain S-box-containing protein
MLNPSQADSDIDFWKKRLFVAFIKYCLPTSLIALIPGLWITIKSGLWIDAGGYTSALGLLCVVAFYKNCSIEHKKILAITIIFLLSVFVISTLGLRGAGLTYLFFIPILTVLTMRPRFAYAAVLLVILTILGFGIILQFNIFQLQLTRQTNCAFWISSNASLVFLDLVTVALIHFIFNGLQSTIQSKQQLKEDYQSVFNGNPLPMWIYDTETLKFIDVNRAAIQHYGYSRNEFLNKRITDIRPKEAQQEVKTLARQYHMSNAQANGLFVHQKKSGDQIHVSIESNGLYFASQNARLVVAEDVTDHLHSRRELVKSNERLKAAQGIGMIAYWGYDYSENKLFWSDEVFELLHIMKTGDITSVAAFSLFIHEEDQRLFLEVLQSPEKKVSSRTIEYRVILPGDQIAYVHQIANYSYDESGNVVSIEGIIQNITERRHFELRIKESELNLKAIYESCIEGFVLIDKKGNIKTFNARANELLKSNTGKICSVGNSIFDCVEESRTAAFNEYLQRVYRGEIVEFEKQYKETNANQRWLHYTLTPVFDNLSIVGVCITGRDISTVKRYLETIEEQNQALLQISWAQSHLVRAPLARIKSLTELITNDEETDDICLLLHYLKNSSDDLDDIIHKISDLTERTGKSLNNKTAFQMCVA